ncbi:MAG TPA: MATE family efflux transporter [Candidatus Limiplasma sp.]|nr:MATE family efflux transporter [Candidatus Limiplasma sp.]
MNATQKLLRKTDADMTSGVIWKQLLEFSGPMVIGLVFQQLYNMVDTIVVGRFVGKEALAAVGSTGSIINMLVGFCAGLATGASVVISQCYGAHDHRKLHDAVHTTITVSFALCVLMTGLGLCIVDPALQMMGTPEDVYGQAKTYLTIYFAGVSGLLIYNMGAGILQAVGDTRRPLYFLCFSAIVNTVLDLVFVLTFHMGVAGVAYATIIAQLLSAILILVVLSQDNAPYGIRWKHLGISPEIMRQILNIGMPSAIQQAVTSFSNVFVQGYINSFGSVCMAGWSSYGKLDALILVPVQSIAMASTTFVGQNYGAHNMKRAREGTKQALILSLVITAVISAVVMLFARTLLSLFTQDADVLDYGRRFTLMISPFYLLICFNQIYAGALRGIGNARAPVIVMLGSFVVFRQLYLLVNKLLGNAFVPVALAYPVGWALCSVLLTVLYLRSAIYKAPDQPVKVTDPVAETQAGPSA